MGDTSRVTPRIGLAGWSEATSRFRSLYPVPSSPDKPSGLQRYAESFDFVEINASFYRQMRRSTFERWAADTPDDFRFSVKMHRGLTHFHRLRDTTSLDAFLDSAEGLGPKLAVILVQLPPSLAFDAATVSSFLAALRQRYAGPAACEPRHASWCEPEVEALIGGYGVGMVRTEIPAEDSPAGIGPAYVRLHGSPRRYASPYSDAQLADLAAWLRRHPDRESFVVFDNTATTAATLNARSLQQMLAAR